MNSNVPLDNAFFKLSPKRTRCELFVSADGNTEKLASGFLKPFVTHLKVAEKQLSDAVHVINLEVGRRKDAATWFNKGIVERFVRFVSTPEVLELLSTLDAEMSQLEGARKMYTLGARHQFSGRSEAKSALATDETKKELVRAIDVRINAVKQDLAAACARASAAGFNPESVSDLLLFADRFDAYRLSEACKNFHSLSQRRPELINQHSLLSPDIHSQWKNFEDSNVCSSSGSDMSIDEPLVVQTDSVRLTATSCSDSQLHNFRIRQQQQQSVDKPATAATEPLNPDSRNSVEKDMEKVEDDPNLSAVSSSNTALQAGVSRQMSVQDRINLFESKKKEQSGSPVVIGGNSGAITSSRLTGAKGEHHRRNPSDLSAEKLVLRRWSGASDMSIDPNSNCSSSSIDQKENGSTAGTPTSSANSHLHINSRNFENDGSGLKEASNVPESSSQISLVLNSSSTCSLSQDQQRSIPQGDVQARDAIYKEGFALTSIEPSGLTKEKVQATTLKNTGGSFSNSGGSVVSRELGFSQIDSKTSPEDLVSDQMVFEVPSRAHLALDVPFHQNDQAGLLSQIGTSTSQMEDAGARPKYASDSQIGFRVSMKKMEAISANIDSVNSEPNTHDFEEQEETEQTNLTVPKLPSKSVSAKVRQGSVSQGLGFPSNASGTDHKKKFQGRRDDILSANGSNAPPLLSRKINEGMEAPPLSLEESQTSRPNTNTVLSVALQLKAEEMEKLFAKHKLKNHGDLIASARRRKTLGDCETKTVEKRPAQFPKQKPEKPLLQQDSISGLENEFHLLGEVENSDLNDIKQKIGDHNPSDFLRGEVYEKYMNKRNAKLSQECSSNRSQKDAKMKEMLDMLDHSQEEMKASITRFSDGQRFSDAHLRAEKMKSFNLNTTIKFKEQMSESLTEDEDDIDLELSEPSTGSQSKKISSNKVLPSSSFTSVGPKYLAKSANSGSIKLRGLTENPVPQSISSFSNSKNENIKSSVVATKATTRCQTKNFTRSKSFVDDTEISKEDRSVWSNSMRKSSATTELKVQIGGEIRQYLKKGNGVIHGSGIFLGKSRILETPEKLKNDEVIVTQKEGSPDMIDESSERAYIDGNNLDLHIDYDVEKPRNSQESCGPESEKDDLMRPLSQRDDSNIFFSKFDSSGNAEDSPEESFGSLNSHVCHSHAYRTEASDIYASLDSPTNSLSWNSHSLSHIVDSEATRMRKKWGSAQVPVIAASVSQQSRRDVTKGFKRLLKFGRKSRGADYLVNDWVSASTASEGDDDPEDGGDFAHKPSDDFRKSRMGYNVTSYDGFNDIGIFSEQAQSLRNSIPNPPSNFRVRDDHLSGSSLKAPRSFFSLSSFRSKAGR